MNIDESKFYFINIIFFKMSQAHWKRLHSRVLQGKNNMERHQRSKGKFTPSKSKGEDQISVRFRNESLSRINDSMMSNSLRDRSLNKSLVKNIKEPIGLKNCTSQVQLKKSVTSEGMNFPRAQRQISGNSHYQSILPPSVSQQHHKKYSNLPVHNVENKSMYQAQIDKIKKQFNEFQEAIRLQLRRQQKIINAMIDKILEQLQYKLIEPSNQTAVQQNKIQQQFSKQGQQLNLKLTESEDVKPNIADNTLIRFDSLRQARKIEKETQKDEGSKEKLSFNRFFDAMTQLKREMKDISSLSSLASPRNGTNDKAWQAALERIKSRR